MLNVVRQSLNVVRVRQENRCLDLDFRTPLIFWRLVIGKIIVILYVILMCIIELFLTELLVIMILLNICQNLGLRGVSKSRSKLLELDRKIEPLESKY